MNSEQRIATARYGVAYDSLSTTVAQAEKNAEQLSTAARILAEFSAQMQSPRWPAAYKKLVINEALKQYPQAAAFISVLIDAKRYNLLNAICAHVNMLLDDRKGISRAIVTSARVLNDARQQAVEKTLSKHYGRTVKATFAADPTLLGGLTAQCNGELLDGSLKTRLAKLQEELTK